MSQTLAIIIALSFAGTKYAMALLFIFSYDFTFWESILLAVGGGMMGSLFFSFFGDAVKAVWYKFFPKKPSNKIVINSRRRMIVKVRQKYGLAGIAFLTPFILTVPVGVLLARTFYKNRLQVFAYMLVSFTFWSFLICGLYHIIGVDFTSLMH